MDGIYRVATTAAEAPRDRGIVGEVIGQFADPNAFYRELVQNAIDAGSETVDVVIEHEPGADVVRVQVRDTGDGMTREIIEDQLLVLFRSTKENDDSKIGKFGIGFASVLSPSPNVVIVNTARDGRRLTVHLQRDLSYELFDAGPATRTGTTVELELAMTGALADVIDGAKDALTRWCRHAAVPIRLIARDGGDTVVEHRIDRPLALDGALVEVRATSDDGHTVAVVGLPARDAPPYAGFFDHGLTLYESEESELGRLAFKVQDPRLGHTISRDNVRRDEAYDRAVAFAREVGRDQLHAAFTTALAEAAGAGNGARYTELVIAWDSAGLAIPRSGWTFPLIHPIAGTRAGTIDSLGPTPRASHGPSPITELLAAAGIAVADIGTTGGPKHELVRVLGRVSDVHVELTRVQLLALDDSDAALLAHTAELIERAHRKPAGLALGELYGAFADRVAISGDRSDAMVVLDDDADSPWLIHRRRAGRKPLGLLSRAPIVINAGFAPVAAARAAAVRDPIGAASVLARLVLLGVGLLDAERSAKLLTATLDAHGLHTGGARR